MNTSVNLPLSGLPEVKFYSPYCSSLKQVGMRSPVSSSYVYLRLRPRSRWRRMVVFGLVSMNGDAPPMVSGEGPVIRLMVSMP